MWLASTIVSLFIHWISASYIQLLSIGLFVFCKQPVCLLFHPCAYLDQTFNSTVTLSCLKTWLFLWTTPCPTHPPTCHYPPSRCGSKINNFIFFLSLDFTMWKCFIGVVKNNEDKAGLCGGRNAFLTHVNEWCLTFHSSRPWMAALTWLFSLLITALCLFTMDIVIYLHQLRGGSLCHSRIVFGDILEIWDQIWIFLLLTCLHQPNVTWDRLSSGTFEQRVAENGWLKVTAVNSVVSLGIYSSHNLIIYVFWVFSDKFTRMIDLCAYANTLIKFPGKEGSEKLVCKRRTRRRKANIISIYR